MAGLRNMRERLAEVVGTVRQSAESVSAASREISAGNHDLSARTGSRPQRCSKRPRRWTKWAPPCARTPKAPAVPTSSPGEAARVAEQGGTVVSNVVNTMKGIHDSSNRISNIIGVIDSIAFQTNILALNAGGGSRPRGRSGPGLCGGGSRGAYLVAAHGHCGQGDRELITASALQVHQGSTQVNEAAPR